MADTYLSDLCAEGPIAVLDDKLYEVTQSGTGHLLVLEPTVMTLSESETIVSLENKFMAPRVLEELAKTRKGQQASGDALRKKLQGLRQQVSSDKMMDFLRAFFGNLSGLYNYLLPPEDKSINIDGIMAKIPDEMPFHEQGVARSTLMSTMHPTELLIWQGDVLSLERTTTVTIGDRLVRDNMGYKLNRSLSLAEFDDTYHGKLKDALKGKIEPFLEQQRAAIERAETFIYDSQRARENVPSEVDLNGAKWGWMKDGDDFWIYKEKGTFILESTKDGVTRKFRFPTCRVGLRLTLENGILGYDSKIGTRVIAAKNIANGRETGPMKDLKGKAFNFPACQKDAQEGNYPYLCISGAGYSYPTPANEKDLRRCIREVLDGTSFKMENGYHDEASPKKPEGYRIFRYLDRDYEQFKGNEVT